MATQTLSLSPKLVSTLQEFEKQILPAKMKPIAENGTLLFSWLVKNGIASQDSILRGDVTVEDFVRASKAIVGSLVWEVKPKLLVGIETAKKGMQGERNDKKDTVAAAAEKKKVEEATAQSEADAKNFKTIAIAIHAFYPTTRFGVLDEARQKAERKRLTDWVASLKGKYASEAILKALLAEIGKLYEKETKSRERV